MKYHNAVMSIFSAFGLLITINAMNRMITIWELILLCIVWFFIGIVFGVIFLFDDKIKEE